MRSVRAISRGDWARNANCILRTSTDRLKTNYRVDRLTDYSFVNSCDFTWRYPVCLRSQTEGTEAMEEGEEEGEEGDEETKIEEKLAEMQETERKDVKR